MILSLRHTDKQFDKSYRKEIYEYSKIFITICKYIIRHIILHYKYFYSWTA